MGEALDWARAQGLSIKDDLSYLREFEHITLARVLLAQDKSDCADRSIHEAIGLLERLLQAAEEGERTGSVIEILVLQALANQIQGDIPAALVPLERALTLAEPEGYVRIFVDEGPPMAVLLAKLQNARGNDLVTPRRTFPWPTSNGSSHCCAENGPRVRGTMKRKKVPPLLHPLHQHLPSRCSTR